MKIGTVYDITFSTTKVDTGVATNADSLPIVRITENGSLLAYTPTVSNLTTGLYIVTIDSSLANGFEVGKRYTVYATATVNSIAGAEGLDSFTIDIRSIDDILPTASYTAPDNAGIALIPTLAEIEASTVIAKEASVSAIPTNPLLADDARLDNLDAPISGVGLGGGGGISWDDLIADNSSVLGSFGRKFAEYGGVSHVIDRSSLDKESKDKLDKLDDKIKEFNETLKNFKGETIDFEKIVDTLKAVMPNATTNIINSKTPADEIANDILIEGIPAIIDAVEKANELIPIYEELLDYMRKKELEYEATINEILN